MASLIMMLCVTHYFEYVLNILIFYLSPSLQESMEEQLKGEEKKSHEDLRFYLKKK